LPQPVNKVAESGKHQSAINATTINTTTARVSPDADSPIKETEPAKADNQPLLAATQPHDIIKNVVPGKEIQLAPKALDMEQQSAIDKPVMASVVKHDAAPVVKKRGIHNLGGLVNALISKVDKRQDKLIEFSDSDDDDANSSLTGVNLGIIKIKRQ